MPFQLFSKRNKSKAVVDSGMVSRYQPAEKNKTPALLNIIGRAQKTFKNYFYKSPERTTEKGSSSAASPASYQYSLYMLRYERRAYIEDCRQALTDDSRVKTSTYMFAGEAVRGDALITVEDTPAISKANFIKARKLAKEIQNMGNPNAESWAAMLITEGDLFIQAVLDEEGQLYKLKRMPSAGMERNTDDRDEFVDPYHAFSQVDLMTNEECDTFPYALMCHERWNHIDGERYGVPELIQIRRIRQLLMLCEDAQVRRRIVRATQRVLWNIGTEEKPTTDHSIIDKFKEDNGMVEGVRKQFDTTEVARDYFGNGLTSAKVLEGDQTISETDDLLYLQNVMDVGLPTPGILYGLDTRSMNPGVLENIRAEWLKQTQRLSNRIKNVYAWAFELALLLNGILPETVTYSIRFSESTIETPSEMIERAMKARQNTAGAGPTAYPDPLISRRTAISRIAEHYAITDIDAEEALIQAELLQAAEMQTQLLSIQQEALMGDTPKAQNKNNGNISRLNKGGAEKQHLPSKSNGLNTNGTTVNLNRTNGTNIQRNERNGSANNAGHLLGSKTTSNNHIKLNDNTVNNLGGKGRLAAPLSSMYGMPEEGTENN